ncbi:MAG: hypothetical protein ACOYU1_00100, partial [Bacteroidota bacterium]
PRNKDKTISTLIFDVIFFLFSIAVVKITFIFYCSVFLRANIKDAKFTKGRDEYFPIPQQQISYVKGIYKQNPGY